jgi:hypothetical protein
MALEKIIRKKYHTRFEVSVTSPSASAVPKMTEFLRENRFRFGRLIVRSDGPSGITLQRRRSSCALQNRKDDHIIIHIS